MTVGGQQLPAVARGGLGARSQHDVDVLGAGPVRPNL